MNIIVVGAGKVGTEIAEALCREKHDVTVIDLDEGKLTELTERTDILTVCGNGASSVLQREAGADKADLLIAVTKRDEVNLLSCMVARKLGCKNTIARVRDESYSEAEYLLRDEMGLSMAVNPELLTAREIYSLLHYPAFLKRETFAKGRAEIVSISISQNSALDGAMLSDLNSILHLHLLICAVRRGNSVEIPSGSFVLKSGDVIYVTAPAESLKELAKKIKHDTPKIKNVLIAGGSLVAENLANLLLNNNIRVKIIEKNREKALALAEKLPDAEISCNDASLFSALQSEGISEADAFVTLTNIDEQNVITAEYAENIGIQKVIAKINRGDLAEFCVASAPYSIVSPRELAAGEVLLYVRAMHNSNGEEMIALHSLADNKIDAMEFRANDKTPHLNQPLMNCPIKKGVLIAAISHFGHVVIPGGSDTIRSGDTVVIVAPHDSQFTSLNDIFTR